MAPLEPQHHDLKYSHLYCGFMAGRQVERPFGVVLSNARVDGSHRLYDVCKSFVVYHFAMPPRPSLPLIKQIHPASDPCKVMRCVHQGKLLHSGTKGGPMYAISAASASPHQGTLFVCSYKAWFVNSVVRRASVLRKHCR
jgi:hypothetical protein